MRMDKATNPQKFSKILERNLFRFEEESKFPQ